MNSQILIFHFAVASLIALFVTHDPVLTKERAETSEDKTAYHPEAGQNSNKLPMLSTGDFLGFYTTIQLPSPTPFAIDVVSFPALNGAPTAISTPWDTYNFIQTDVLLPTNTSAYNTSTKDLVCLISREQQLLSYNDASGTALSPINVSPSTTTAPVFLQGTLYGIEVENNGYASGNTVDFDVVSIDPMTGLMNGVSPFQFTPNPGFYSFTHESMSSATNRIDELYFLSGSNLVTVTNPNPFTPQLCYIDLAPLNTPNNYYYFYGLEYRNPGQLLAIRETFANGNRTAVDLVEILFNAQTCTLFGIIPLFDIQANFAPSPAGWIINNEFYSTTFDTCQQRYYLSTLFNLTSGSRLVEIDLATATHTEQILPKYLFGIEWKYTPCPCEAEFTFNSLDSCQTYQFTNLSSGSPPQTYFWDFGDPLSGTNNTSILQHPSHVFTTCGLYNVCLTVTGPGCMATVCHQVQVSDNIPPVALCKNGLVLPLNANCTASVTTTDIDNGSFDNCQIQSMIVTPNTFPQCGNYPVTLTVTDWCGNTSTCITNVQVVDNSPPFITCPADVYVTTTASNCMMIVNGLQWLTLGDNCGTPAVTYNVTGASNFSGNGDVSGLMFNQGVSIVTYTAMDACGNSNSCSFKIILTCACNCPANLIQNPGFSNGAIFGNMGFIGQSNNWHNGNNSASTVIGNPSCCDPVSIQMLGLSNQGSSIYQNGLSFMPGHHYKISFCARLYVTNPNNANLKFGFTGTNAPITGAFNAYNCSNCENIGSTPVITSTGWVTYTLPIWTPSQFRDVIFIRALSAGTNWANGLIDNICVQEVFYLCCDDEQAFIENTDNALNTRAEQETWEGVFEAGILMECNSVDYIDWGDGNVTNGPILGNTTVRHSYDKAGTYQVEYRVREFDPQDTSQIACLSHVFIDDIVIFPDSCFCGGFSDMIIASQGVQAVQVECGSGPFALGCPLSGGGYDLTGIFYCGGTTCSDQPEISWLLSGPTGVFTGTVNANPYFGISLLPAYVAQPGVYSLSLSGLCGDQNCFCLIEFVVDCPDLCPCAPQDILAFSNAVSMGFAQATLASACNSCFSPIALSDCEKVEWHIGIITPTPQATTYGNQNFCHSFPNGGNYTIIMVVSRKKSDGTDCETFTYSRQVNINCLTVPDCHDPRINNPGFGEGSVSGGLNSGGSTTGWVGESGNPELLDSVIGSPDGWVISLVGNQDNGDVLVNTEAICLPADEGVIHLRARAPCDCRPIEPVSPGKRPCDKLRIAFQTQNEEKTIASFPLTDLDSSGWWDIAIPYDISGWAGIDTCDNDPGTLPIWLRMSVSNALTNEQGGPLTFTELWIDDVCLDNLVATYTPGSDLSTLLFPNPTSGELIVKFDPDSGKEKTLQVIDLTGKIELHKKVESGKNIHELELFNLPPGMYFLQIVSDGQVVYIDKFVKQ